MNDKEQCEFIKACFDNIFTEEYPYWNVEENVPLDMRIGSVNEEGWVRWKLVDSLLKDEDIIEYENVIDNLLPGLFKTFLKTYYFCDSFTLQNPEFIKFKNQFKDRNEFYEHSSEYSGFFAEITFLKLPCENTLNDYKELIINGYPLIKAGYIPFAEWQDGQGFVCFDTQQISEDNDFKIVWFDHEELFDLGDKRCEIRKEVQSLARNLFQSFQELLQVMFLKQEI